MGKQSNDNFLETAEILKAIAHPVRLCILKNLKDAKMSGKPISNVAQIQACLDIPQSTLSQHLQKMKSVGIVVGVRNGLEISYAINDTRIEDLLQIMLTE